MLSKISESQIIKVWQHQLLDRTRLVTEDGKPIEIIYPGRLNDDQGADFRDAVIAINRGLIKGDIEVHVKSSGWREHQHHRDVGYNRVILHVVMWHDAKTATNLQNGRAVPILALHKYINIPVSQWPNLVCSSTTLNMPCLKVGQRLTTGTILGFLDRAGEERFLAKAARFQTDLAQVEASQSLYQGIMEALGYSKNKFPMLKLARSLPLHILGSLTKDGISDEERLARQQALLLGMAGLLPSQRQAQQSEISSDDQWVDKLEGLWASSHHTKAMLSSAWHLFKVRPNNFPVRRLVAMSYLVLRYKQGGILQAVIHMLKEIPSSQGHHRLAEGLLVSADGY